MGANVGQGVSDPPQQTLSRLVDRCACFRQMFLLRFDVWHAACFRTLSCYDAVNASSADVVGTFRQMFCLRYDVRHAFELNPAVTDVSLAVVVGTTHVSTDVMFPLARPRPLKANLATNAFVAQMIEPMMRKRRSCINPVNQQLGFGL